GTMATGCRDVEQEHAARLERVVDACCERADRLAPGPLVGRVVERLADRRDRDAAGERRVEQRSDPERRARRRRARELDHRGRDVDAGDVVPRVAHRGREDPGAAPQVHDGPAGQAGRVEQPDERAGRLARERPERVVVNPRLVRPVEHPPPPSVKRGGHIVAVSLHGTQVGNLTESYKYSYAPTVMDDLDTVQRALETLFRLNASRKVHARQAAAAGVVVSQPGVTLLRRIDDAGPSSLGELARLTHMDPAAAG